MDFGLWGLLAPVGRGVLTGPVDGPNPPPPIRPAARAIRDCPASSASPPFRTIHKLPIYRRASSALTTRAPGDSSHPRLRAHHHLVLKTTWDSLSAAVREVDESVIELGTTNRPRFDAGGPPGGKEGGAAIRAMGPTCAIREHRSISAKRRPRGRDLSLLFTGP